MCLTNAAESLADRIERTGKETTALAELGELLGMDTAPRYIESYDISNTAGDENVAAMVVFCDGRPLRSNYRKFKIKGFLGQDDYRSMAEVIDRRLEEYKKGTDEAFSVLPDLILLDGGKGQISAVIPVMEKHNINIPLFGMVKDSKHKTRAIATSGGDISFKPTRLSFNLVTKIQDETHRCAITFHKNRKSKSMLESELTSIQGVGAKRANLLFKKFKTLKAIKSANIEELSSVTGIDNKTAENIYRYFHK
jgi:excinuclease ABC subunit C